MTRPQSVTPGLAKGEDSKVVCQCGHQFSASVDAKQATCPACGESLDWGLRKN